MTGILPTLFVKATLSTAPDYNPAHRVYKRVKERKIQRIPEQFEMSKLLQAILKEDLIYKVYFLISITTGLRRGEICALKWRNLKTNNVLEIANSCCRIPGKGIVETDTKNHRTRSVILSPFVHDFLGELCAEQCRNSKSGIDPNGYIFVNSKGAQIHPDSFSRKMKNMIKETNLPKEFHLHTMRHFFASYLLQNNVSKQVAADLLGHGDTSFLERTYCHPQLYAKHHAASLLEN